MVLLTRTICGVSISLIFGVVIVIAQRNSGEGDGVYRMIYDPIPASSPCYRKLNGTHQIGCASSLGGDVGVLHLIENDESLDWVIKTGPHSPYVAVLYPEELSSQLMSKLKHSQRVSGVLVLNTTKTVLDLEKFSTDNSCPNKGFGLFTNASMPNYCSNWNAPGDGLAYERFDFPVFFVQDEKNSTSVLKCFDTFNRPINGTARDWPLCAAQLKSFMMAAVDTPTCLRRSDRFNIEQTSDKVCDALGDLNVWTSVVPSNQSEPYTSGSVVIVAARFDSAALFDQMARGTDSAATGLVTLLLVLKQLSQFKSLMNSKTVRNVYFILFHGESFGYIGSSRMVYDMKNGNFPAGINKLDADVTAKLNLTDIKYFIEIGQVGLSNESEGYWIHEWDETLSKSLSASLVTEGHGVQLNLQKVLTHDRGFPPSSLQSFLKERSDIPGILIANHEKEFRNKFYNSIYDDASRLNYNGENSVLSKKIAKLAATVANTILKLVEHDDLAKVTVDQNSLALTDELLQCYTVSANCSLFQKMAGHDKLPSTPFDMYVGVHRHYLPVTTLTRMLMIYFQGDNVTSIKDESSCKTPDIKKNVVYQWIDGSCYESAVNHSVAQSPAFIIPNYDWTSGEYSTWTESVWNRFEVRIFIKPSQAHEIITLVSGIIIFLISFVVVGFINFKSDTIFPTRPAGITC